MIPLPRGVLLAGVACVAVTALTARASAQGSGQALLDEVAKAYRDLPGYADEGKLRITMAFEKEKKDITVPMAIQFARPNRLAIDAGTVVVKDDGEKLTIAVVPLKEFTVAAAPKTLTLESFDNNTLGALLFSGPTAPPLATVLTLLLKEDAAPTLKENREVVLDPDQKEQGATRKVLRLHPARGFDLRLLIDPETKLVRRVEVVPGEEDRARMKEQAGLSDVAIAWDSGTISTSKPADKAFAFEPPPGFTKVADLPSLAAPGEGPKRPFEDMLGKPGPDFTLTVLDGPGKTRKVSKADLAGKVVMIDFWATWCPPCMAELPEVQKLVDAYAKAGKPVVVAAVSIDSEPGDLEGIRRLVEKTLAEKELKLTEGPVAMVALDPSGGIARSYNVAGIPTVVLLDTKGNVQAVHVGFEPDVRDTLTDDIDTLLDGRSLVEPKPAPAPAKPATQK